MSWLSDIVSPKLRDIVGSPREKTEEDWITCPRCGHRARTSAWIDAQRICPACDHHLPMNAVERLALIFGDEDYHAIDLPKVPVDPLRFRDLKRYTDRIKEAQAATGQAEALVVCHGPIANETVVVAALNPEFMDGSIGTSVGEGLITAARLAIVQESALVVVVSSSGIRLQEGAHALMQPIRIAVAINQVRERRLPYIVILTSPTSEAVASFFIQSAHIVIAEPGAIDVKVEPPTESERVDETDGAKPSEEHLNSGLETAYADIVVHRRELHGTLAHLIDLLKHPGPSAEVLPLHGDANAGTQG